MYAAELRLSASHMSSILLSLRDNVDITIIYFFNCYCDTSFFLKTVAQLFFHLDHTNDI